MKLEILGKAEKISPETVQVIITFQTIDESDKRKRNLLLRFTQCFSKETYWEFHKKIKWTKFQGPSHLSLFGFYSEEEKDEERFWDSHAEQEISGDEGEYE